MTFENERLYSWSPQQSAVGPGDNWEKWFSFDRVIQGRATVLTEAQEKELQRKMKTDPNFKSSTPGYR